MSCKVLKKLLGYEICIFEREGTLYNGDSVVLIRKADFTEIVNLETMDHETGDRIERDITRETVYGYIRDNRDKIIKLQSPEHR